MAAAHHSLALIFLRASQALPKGQNMGGNGLITVSSNLSYIIEPLPDSEGQHLIYRSEHLKLPLGSCGIEHSKPTTRDWALQFTQQTKKRPRRMKREDLNSMKYVELYLVADYAEELEEWAA
ncbi:Disintegrin and metalloproteinase domain-containing protein 19 [Saguinus oedipus]|uniref:Disintegrin and metalloproteinase domain-containing protein 19 n=1 Tax=Saguinus oedipus TaxID=9490 RepID=A0ABQ9W5W3_SAGOE|nr:Disintegrin and metalloproteinase domain-containing protein 19 [Saguinus oedipus]